jgi:hypothetical protein
MENEKKEEKMWCWGEGGGVRSMGRAFRQQYTVYLVESTGRWCKL